MSLTETVAPAREPISLGEAKDHLRVDGVDDDAYISGLIVAVRHHAESVTKRALITQTWRLDLGGFPYEITVPKPVLQSVSLIEYVDDAGATQTLAASEYQVDIAAQPGRVRPAFGKTWPTTRAVYNAASVTFIAGYGTEESDIPDGLKSGMKMLLNHLYENREAVVLGVPVARLPIGLNWLLFPYSATRWD